MRGVAPALLSAAIAVHTALATPVIHHRSPYAVKETHAVPRGWKKLDRADGDRVVQLQIGLKQGNFDELEKHLYEGESRRGPLAGVRSPEDTMVNTVQFRRRNHDVPLDNLNTADSSKTR